MFRGKSTPCFERWRMNKGQGILQIVYCNLADIVIKSSREWTRIVQPETTGKQEKP
jgi:hypothetical protein